MSMKDHVKQDDTSPDSPEAKAAQAFIDAGPKPVVEANDSKPVVPLRRLVKLRDLGPRLPVGLTSDGVIAPNLSLRKWRTAEERQMGKLKKPNANMAEHVGLVVACMCTEFNGQIWNDMPKNVEEFSRRRVAINQALMGDVFYAYTYLRRDALGPIVNMRVVCPHCGKEQRVPADLDTLEVVTADSADVVNYRYDLKRPVDIRGKTVERLNMVAPRWYAMESAVDSGTDESEVKAAMLRSCIVGFNDSPDKIQAVDSDVDELEKVDLEGVLSAMDQHTVGPNMALNGACIKCRREYKQSINWRYDDFFGHSSR